MLPIAPRPVTSRTTLAYTTITCTYSNGRAILSCLQVALTQTPPLFQLHLSVGIVEAEAVHRIVRGGQAHRRGYSVQPYLLLVSNCLGPDGLYHFKLSARILVECSGWSSFRGAGARTDDLARIRDVTAVVHRTNVIFEAGLFFGRWGRDRCFLVQPRSRPDLVLPTDLVGITPATYDETFSTENPEAALGPACTQIRNAFQASASFQRSLKISARPKIEDVSKGLTFPKKLDFRIHNPTTSGVLVTSLGFTVGRVVTGDSRLRAGAKNQFKIDFLVVKEGGQDIYRPEAILKAGESVRAWLGLDPNTDDTLFREALSTGTTAKSAPGGSVATGWPTHSNIASMSSGSSFLGQSRCREIAGNDPVA
jgi:hypothetical protein